MNIDKLTSDGWINPQGEFFPCDVSLSHEINAEPLLLKYYGIESAVCGDKLIERGWIKVTTSLMFDIYMGNGLYNEMNEEQAETFEAWRGKYDM